MLLFVHSHKFRTRNGKFYSPGGLNDAVMKRYTDIFGKVKVVARIIETDSIEGLSEIKNDLVEIVDYRKIGLSGLKNNVKQSKYIIARLPSLIGYITIYFANKFNKKRLVEVVGCAFDALWNHSFIGKILAVPNLIMMKRTVRKANFALYVTSSFLQMKYPCSGETVSCSDVILTEVDKNVLENRISKISNKDINDPVIIGTIGAIDVKYKGQEHVIKAIANLNEPQQHYEYHLVGGGNEEYLKAISKKYEIENSIIFYGSIAHKDINIFIDKIDIYIQPSQTEGLPRALVEAMNRACPSIGSNRGGIPELLDKDYIFDPKELSTLLNTLTKFNKEIMIEQAIRNYNEAQKYEKKKLEKLRNEFLLKFLAT